jgi:hypothetical protein
MIEARAFTNDLFCVWFSQDRELCRSYVAAKRLLLGRGFNRCSVVGARGGKEVALHLERRRGASGPCLLTPSQGAEC